MPYTYYRLDAFAKTEQGGNPAAVVINSDHLGDDEMQQIAKAIGLSETAFIMASKVADFKIRFFTPTDEVNLCGHATIASFYLLKHLNIIKDGVYQQETKAGILSVHLEGDFVWMEQAKPVFYQMADPDEIAFSLGITQAGFLEGYPIQVVSTGISDLFVPIRSLDLLLSLKPDMHQVALISQKYRTIGYHLFSMETYGGTCHTRSIAPLIGIDEEAATGTANGALACYLAHHGLKKVDETPWVMEQGYGMNRPSEIQVKLVMNQDTILEVWVGGTAKNIQKVIL